MMTILLYHGFRQKRNKIKFENAGLVTGKRGKRGDVLFASYIFEHSFAFLTGVGRFNDGVGWWRWI